MDSSSRAFQSSCRARKTSSRLENQRRSFGNRSLDVFQYSQEVIVLGKAISVTRSWEMASLSNGVLYGHCDENIGASVAKRRDPSQRLTPYTPPQIDLVELCSSGLFTFTRIHASRIQPIRRYTYIHCFFCLVTLSFVFGSDLVFL